MTNLQLYETIFRRRSIRKYDMATLPDAALTELRNYLQTLKPLDEKIKVEFSALGTKDVKNLLPIKAPHYICLYSEKKDGYLMNAGFLLQQVDLYLSAAGLASCWLGMAKPTKQVPELINDLGFVILIAFGKTNEPVHRENTADFNRKSYGDICEIAGLEELLEPVRLAPSASNSQPWFFSGHADEITVSRQKLNLIRAQMYGKMNQIDIGIALCHLWLSLAHQGKSASFDFSKAPAPAGYEVMAKVKTGSIVKCLQE